MLGERKTKTKTAERFVNHEGELHLILLVTSRDRLLSRLKVDETKKNQKAGKKQTQNERKRENIAALDLTFYSESDNETRPEPKCRGGGAQQKPRVDTAESGAMLFR